MDKLFEVFIISGLLLLFFTMIFELIRFAIDD